jgi:enoyl-[acyl-carrier protein] reductase II
LSSAYSVLLTVCSEVLLVRPWKSAEVAGCGGGVADIRRQLWKRGHGKVKTRITELFGIRYPIIQAGMVWTAGYKLAVAVSEAGGLGLIGAGSMKADLLREQISLARGRTEKPIGVNVPISRSDVAELLRVIIDEKVRIVFTSSGHPAKYTGLLKDSGCLVVHVVAAVKHALKAAEAECDAVVAEGFEAGGHNGVDEITTLTLVPQVVDAISLPVVAAGGIADGRGMAAALALGAEAVQVGTRFAATEEASAHAAFKQAIVEAKDGDTVLTLRKAAPVRMLRNAFARRAMEAEQRGAGKDELQALIGQKREMKGIFEGDTEEGMLEMGQSAGLVKEILPAREVVRRMMEEYQAAKERLA